LVYNEEGFEGAMVRISFFLVFLNHNMLKHAWQLQQQTIYGYEMVTISFFCYVEKSA
jgi:hypothetical protein